MIQKIFLRFRPDQLVDFQGKGTYSEPEFVWNIPVGVTALLFFSPLKNLVNNMKMISLQVILIMERFIILN